MPIRNLVIRLVKKFVWLMSLIFLKAGICGNFVGCKERRRSLQRPLEGCTKRGEELWCSRLALPPTSILPLLGNSWGEIEKFYVFF